MRKIYALDGEVYNLLVNKIAYKFEMGMSGYFIRHDTGYLFIKRDTLDDKNITIELNMSSVSGIDTSKQNVSYIFSEEFSERVRELMYDKIDEINDSWKTEHLKIREYIKTIN